MKCSHEAFYLSGNKRFSIQKNLGFWELFCIMENRNFKDARNDPKKRVWTGHIAAPMKKTPQTNQKKSSKLGWKFLHVI